MVYTGVKEILTRNKMPWFFGSLFFKIDKTGHYINKYDVVHIVLVTLFTKVVRSSAPIKGGWGYSKKRLQNNFNFVNVVIS